MNTIIENLTVKRLLGVLGIFVALYAIDSYFERKIERATNDDSFIRKMAQNIRPSVIFDNNGSVLVDLGAMEYLSDINILDLEVDGSLSTGKIIVSPNRYLANAPLLSIIDDEHFDISYERGNKFDWIYELKPVVVSTDGRRFRLRLEILK